MRLIQTLPLSTSAALLIAAALPSALQANPTGGASPSTFNFTDGFDVGVPPGGLVAASGWDIASLSFVHDPVADTLTATIAMQMGKIAGDADGNGDPSAMAAGVSGTDVANLGSQEAFAVAFDTDLNGTLDAVIGVAASDTLNTTTRALRVARYAPGTNVGSSFGTTISGPSATLAHVPSAAQPNFVFTVTGWSTLFAPGRAPTRFSFHAFAGSFVDGGIGEDNATGNTLQPSQSLTFKDPLDVGLPPGSGIPVSGWDMSDASFDWTSATDTMKVRLKFGGGAGGAIAGDADNNGDPSAMRPTLSGTDVADLGSQEAIAVAFDFNRDGTFDKVIGVPASGALNTATRVLKVSNFAAGTNVGTSFGAPDTTGVVATLTNVPSAAFPDFEFTVTNWSCLASDPNDFRFHAFAGSFVDGGIGEDNFIGDVLQPMTVSTSELLPPDPAQANGRRFVIGVRGKPGVPPVVRGGSNLANLPDVTAQSEITETSPGNFKVKSQFVPPSILRWFMKVQRP
jgi:hypothetical protein